MLFLQFLIAAIVIPAALACPYANKGGNLRGVSPGKLIPFYCYSDQRLFSIIFVL